MLSIAAAKLGFAPGRRASTSTRVAVEVDRARTPPRTASRSRPASPTRSRTQLPAADVVVANIALDAVEALARAARRAGALITSGYLERDEPRARGLAPTSSGATLDGWAADLLGAHAVEFAPPMATFSVRFLGCKVSHVDAHEVRERLLADGHVERDGGADVAVVNTCCVTHEARLEVAAGGRARRAHARPRLRHRLRREPRRATRSPGLPENVVVVARRSEETPAFVAGDVGAIGCVQADARLDRVRAFVKVQDGCSFSCNFCVIPLVRGASRSRRAAAVLAEIRRRVAQGHREVVLTGINLGCFRDREAGYDLPRLVREAGATPGLAPPAALVDRGQPRRATTLVARCARRRPSSRHLHVPLQSGDDGVLRAMGRRYTVGDVPAPARAARATST